MCGEQHLLPGIEEKQQGSPPRVRGTGLGVGTKRENSRITPACAGNSYTSLSSAKVSRDHPRVCGEQTIAHLSLLCGAGSPPRVRGTVHIRFQDLSGVGITPACAGNSVLAIILHE